MRGKEEHIKLVLEANKQLRTKEKTVKEEKGQEIQQLVTSEIEGRMGVAS